MDQGEASNDHAPLPKRPPPRRDAAALGFGVAFMGLAILALLRAAGLHIATAWLYAAVLIGLGGAGALIARARASS